MRKDWDASARRLQEGLHEWQSADKLIKMLSPTFLPSDFASKALFDPALCLRGAEAACSGGRELCILILERKHGRQCPRCIPSYGVHVPLRTSHTNPLTRRAPPTCLLTFLLSSGMPSFPPGGSGSRTPQLSGFRRVHVGLLNIVSRMKIIERFITLVPPATVLSKGSMGSVDKWKQSGHPILHWTGAFYQTDIAQIEEKAMDANASAPSSIMILSIVGMRLAARQAGS